MLVLDPENSEGAMAPLAPPLIQTLSISGISSRGKDHVEKLHLATLNTIIKGDAKKNDTNTFNHNDF